MGAGRGWVGTPVGDPSASAPSAEDATTFSESRNVTPKQPS
jgi:hypothetical protein